MDKRKKCLLSSLINDFRESIRHNITSRTCIPLMDEKAERIKKGTGQPERPPGSSIVNYTYVTSLLLKTRSSGSPSLKPFSKYLSDPDTG
jgi:hypothetical protein